MGRQWDETGCLLVVELALSCISFKMLIFIKIIFSPSNGIKVQSIIAVNIFWVEKPRL